MTRPIIDVDLEAIAVVAFSQNQDLALPDHEAIVTYAPEYQGEEIDIEPGFAPNIEGGEIIDFADFAAIHWQIPHSAAAAYVGRKTGADCQIGEIAASKHGLKIAEFLYQKLSESPFARRTILGKSTLHMDLIAAVLGYTTALSAEINRCAKGDNTTPQQPEFEPVFSSTRGADLA